MLKSSLVVSVLLVSAHAFAQPIPDQPPIPAESTPDPAKPIEPVKPIEPIEPVVPVKPVQPPVPPPIAPKADKPAPDVSPTIVKGKTELQFYGFVQLYGIYDTTQGLNEQEQNSALSRPGTYTGEHGQTMFSARHSRFGLKIARPLTDDVKASGQFEMDFLNTVPAGFSEAQQFQNAMMRFRHLYLKIETPWVDVLAGQSWGLFGWQSQFHPNSVEIQGLPGQVYSRIPQLRLSKTIKTDDVTVDIAVAALRPPQRASATPDGQAGVKVTFNKLKGWRTKGAADSGIDAAAIGLSGIGRRFAVDEFSAAPHSQVVKYGYGVSIDALLPIIPATKESHANALTLTASFVTGAGITDQYNGLNFGVASPALANPTMATPAPTFTPNVDGGLAMFWLNPTTMQYELHPIHSLSYMAGLQYYLPGSGKVWVSGNYGHLKSDNARDYGAKAWSSSDYVDGNLFFDPIPNLRLGTAFSYQNQTFAVADADGKTDATNYRVTGTMLLMF